MGQQASKAAALATAVTEASAVTVTLTMTVEVTVGTTATAVTATAATAAAATAATAAAHSNRKLAQKNCHGTAVQASAHKSKAEDTAQKVIRAHSENKAFHTYNDVCGCVAV